jgi:hypothetical protein
MNACSTDPAGAELDALPAEMNTLKRLHVDDAAFP